MIDSVLAFFSSRKQQDNAPFWLLNLFPFFRYHFAVAPW
jgi:hypothetical protein